MAIRRYSASKIHTAFAGFLLVASLAAFPAGPKAFASDGELERCRFLHDRIERYTALRRAGGPGAQMERWRKAREKHAREYRQRRCHRFGRRLTIRS